MNGKEFLEKIFGIGNLEEGVMELLSSKVISKKYLRGQLIPSGNNRNIFCVARGTIKSYIVTDDGKEIFNNIFNKGDVFGYLFCLSVNEYARVASDSAQIYLINSSDILDVSLQNIPRDYFSNLENRITQTESYFLKLMSLGVKERLIFFLEHLARKKGQRTEDKITIECSLTASEIADSICATRQSVSWHLNELKKASWLIKTNSIIELKNLSFERFIKGEPHHELSTV